jgi:putative restriction endonuclease
VADLEAMPDDGNRYELIDGTLIVRPAPGLRHQKIVVRLACRLEPACPDDMHVLAAPFAVRPSNITEVQPKLDANDRYQLVAEVKGTDTYEATRPFPVSIVPVGLLGNLAP